jgi:UDP-sugar pyrophosphorylase
LWIAAAVMEYVHTKVPEALATQFRQQIDLLQRLNQQHLFADWDDNRTEDGDAALGEKRVFFEQVAQLDRTTPGGLAAYVSRARDLLQTSLQGTNPLEGWTPSVPEGISLTPFSNEYLNFEEIGKRELGRCGFILVAGGIGERLGYSGIKIALPYQTVTRASYIELYCQQILAIQSRYGVEGIKLPLAIMTSDDTHARTVELLANNNYFGLQRDHVTILKQEKVPALQSSNADIAKLSKYIIDTKPHGHGDVHSLMYSSGTADRWKATGMQWCSFFQDPNSWGCRTLGGGVGVSAQRQLDVNSMTVPRVAKQAVGGIVKLSHEGTGRSMTVNVEYNQLDPLLRATISPEGDVNMPDTGLSAFPGNINQLCFRMDSYCSTLAVTNGVIAEFVNPKYKDASRLAFKKPTRLECMMQDYPRALDGNARVGFTLAPAWLCYNPCKNNAADAAIAQRGGIPAHCAMSAEFDLFNANAQLLKLIGCRVDLAEEALKYFDVITERPAPKIVFHPSFALFPSEIKARFRNPSETHFTKNSSLVVKGDAVFGSMRLEGALRVEISSARSAEVSGAVSNEGLSLVPFESLSEDRVNEIDTLRGDRIIVSEETVVPEVSACMTNGVICLTAAH